MSTGYTVEILNGNVKTLKEFAEVCAKGFGATAHMKDEPLNAPYRKAEVNPEHKKSMRKLLKTLKEFKEVTDEQLVIDEHNALIKSHKHFTEKIEKIKQAKKDFNKMLLEAQMWEPPTKDHKPIKKFMIDEIKKTIEFDCDVKPVKELIKDIDKRLKNIDAEFIRKNHIEGLERQIDYHKQSHDLDLKHVEQSNDWVETLMKSF